MCGPRATKPNNGLFVQPVYVLYWLLSSDVLKVEDENTVLSFIFHYTSLARGRLASQQEAILAADQLIKCLRLNYCDLHNLMSAIRKNPTLQSSPVMLDAFNREISARSQIKKQPSLSRLLNGFSSAPASETQADDFCGRPRKYFIEAKIKDMGRSKLLNCSQDVGLALLEELTKWAFESRIQDINESQARLNPY